jgi:3-oxoacyl-[acyl-carrier protein] reductase
VALVFDASGVESVSELRTLYDFFHAWLPRLEPCGRVVVLGRAESPTPEVAAAQAALEGFVRSVAKEVGRSGSTANLLRVAKDAQARLGPVLGYLLSTRSAFISAQPLVVTGVAKDLGVTTPSVRSLEAKVALVTGAARGIGEATARQLAQEGAHVVLVDRPQEKETLGQLAEAIAGTALPVDLGEEGAPGLIEGALQARGGVDVVVHNAGLTRDKTLTRMKSEQWDAVLGVNLDAVLRVHAMIEPLLHPGGRVICLSSVSGIAGNVGQSNYAASKAGLAGWVRAQAIRWAGQGVTVNAVAPGFIETRMTAAIPLAVREAGRRLSALGQGGQPVDVAQAITFLATSGAQGLTGSTLRVCGGALIGA